MILIVSLDAPPALMEPTSKLTQAASKGRPMIAGSPARIGKNVFAILVPPCPCHRRRGPRHQPWGRGWLVAVVYPTALLRRSRVRISWHFARDREPCQVSYTTTPLLLCATLPNSGSRDGCHHGQAAWASVSDRRGCGVWPVGAGVDDFGPGQLVSVASAHGGHTSHPRLLRTRAR
jgi:hypothetical protein